jgi:formate dehydrogenase beta subunit
MNRVIFSSWDGKVVDNRGLHPDDYTTLQDLRLPLEFNGRQVRAFMSWKGLLVADETVDIVDMAHAYLGEAQKLACGECSVGYLGLKVMLGILAGIAGGKGREGDIELLRWLGAGIKENARCSFCSSAIIPLLDAFDHFREEFIKPRSRKRRAKPYMLRVTAPCMEACPAHQDAPGYIELIGNYRYKEALEVVKETNCLPQTIGRACVAFCEANCTRNEIDKPIAIRALKRFAAEYGTGTDSEPLPGIVRERPKVAIIGAGPAGLAASYNLALLGYRVTIFDELPAAGGMALVGIPPYRLPKDVLAAEVDTFNKLGVEIKLNTRLGRDITLKRLSRQGFKAIFIATGAHLGRESDIENWREGHPGLVDGTKFLRDVNLGKKVKAKDKVMIVGGGNVAIDCARTCIRLGGKNVTIVYRRSRVEMPARKEEVEAAEEEGIKIHFLAVPVKVLTEGKRVIGAECIRMELGKPDASGRRRPVPVKGSEFTITTDMIIPAIGETPDLSFSTQGELETTEQGTIKVAPFTYKTSQTGIFSAGDCVTGPATLIEAVAAGNKAARSIDQYLTSGIVAPSEEDVKERLTHDIGLSREWGGGIIARRKRQSPEQLPSADRVQSFDEVEKCLTAESAVKEAERCLRCYRVMLLAVASRRQGD